MDLPFTAQNIQYAENFLAQGDMGTALPMLLALRDQAEEYIEAECQTTDDTQYFSFADTFERLAYRKVEDDPRTLVQVEIPFDRLYSDLAFAYIRQQEYVLARDMLMQAVRWNPMNCNYRLDLAELFRALGDKQEWAALSVSVLKRASDPVAGGRAYANLGQFFLDEDNLAAAVGCARLAAGTAGDDTRTVRLMNRLNSEHSDWQELTDDHVMAELMQQGIPTSPNAEIAICLLMCASDAAAAGDRNEATRLTVRARDLVGEPASKVLIKLIHESDEELAREKAAHADLNFVVTRPANGASKDDSEDGGADAAGADAGTADATDAAGDAPAGDVAPEADAVPEAGSDAAAHSEGESTDARS